jgi:hypothetical protein
MVDAERAGEKLAELMGHLGVHFTRREPFAQAGKYVRGLLSDLPRKNCWALAEYAGDATPDRMQRLLERASWDTLAAMGTVRDFVAGHLAGDGGARRERGGEDRHGDLRGETAVRRLRRQGRQRRQRGQRDLQHRPRTLCRSKT